MTLACHHLGNCQTDADAVAAWHCERLLKALHGALLVSQRAQSLARRNQDSTLLGLIGWRELCRLGGLFCPLDITQSLLSIVQLGISTCKLCVDIVVVGRKLLRNLQFIDRPVIQSLP